MRREVVPVIGAFLVLFPPVVQADSAPKCNYKNLVSCPKIGCSKPGSPLAVTNSKKRSIAINGTPTEIDFTDLKDLQGDVDAVFANGPVVIKGEKVSSARNMKAAPRKILLSGLKAGSKTFSEGDYVELSGFIASKKLPPHPNTGESVNCKLKGESNNDYHINITPSKNQNETAGVVVEMIPQNPHRTNRDWDLKKLDALQQKQLPVRIRGRLFFDNEHKPNTSAKSGGDPRRFSVWEIHPLSAFLVCASGSCTKNAEWTLLENWEP